MKIHTILLKLRTSLNKTQTEVAKETGLSRVQYNQYENNYYNIPIKHLNTLSNYYNVSIDYLLNLTPIMKYDNSKKEIDKIKAGERLKEFRKENNLTQKKLAEILHTTFSSIAFNEKGRNLISTPFLYTICSKYHISADYFLGKTNSPKYFE